MRTLEQIDADLSTQSKIVVEANMIIAQLKQEKVELLSPIKVGDTVSCKDTGYLYIVEKCVLVGATKIFYEGRKLKNNGEPYRLQQRIYSKELIKVETDV